MKIPFGYNAIMGILYGMMLAIIGYIFASVADTVVGFGVANFALGIAIALWIGSFAVGYVKDVKSSD